MPTDRPSFLVLMMDDLRTLFATYGHTGRGHAAAAPNMDKLARESLVFEQAYAQVAVCVPSRNSLMTGRRRSSKRPLASTTSFFTLDVDQRGQGAGPALPVVSRLRLAHGRRANRARVHVEDLGGVPYSPRSHMPSSGAYAAT